MGRRREEGVEDLERVTSNSGGGSFPGGVDVVGGGAELTRSSRHRCDWACVFGLLREVGPAGVVRVWTVEDEGGTDWKAWMGSASKNSWATMKGVLDRADRCELR